MKRVRTLGFWFYACFCVCFCLVIVSKTGTAEAKSFTRTLQKGVSVSDIAKRFYDREDFAVFIAAASEFKPYGDGSAGVGEVVVIPTTWTYRLRPDDTWGNLGKDYLGDSRRGSMLAKKNYKDPKKRVPSGHLINMPFHVPYKATSRVTLKNVARVFSVGLPRTGVRELERMIKEYNHLKKPHLKAGQKILIPVFHVQVKGALLATEGPIPDPGSQRRAKAMAKTIEGHLSKGEYGKVIAIASESMQEIEGAPQVVAKIMLYLCTAGVALNQKALAQKAALKSLVLDSEITLDPRKISPKVRAVFQRVRNSGRNSGRTNSGRTSNGSD